MKVLGVKNAEFCVTQDGSNHLPTNKKHKHYKPILAAVKAAEVRKE